MKKAYYIVTILITILPLVMHAQSYYGSGYSRYNSAYGEDDDEGDNSSNACLQYFYASTPNDTNKAVFKKVTIFNYTSYDSAMKGKRLVDKSIVTFNKAGMVLTTEGMDSLGKITDSSRHRYNADNMEVYSSDYSLLGDTGAMVMRSQEWMRYDKKGNEVFDSTFRMDESSNTGGEINMYCFTYDAKGNQTMNKRLWGERDGEFDSSVTWYAYDTAGRVLWTKVLSSSDTSQEYRRYDEWGNTIFFASVSRGDSSYSHIVRDSTGLVLKRERYEEGKLSSTYNAVTDPKDKHVTETEEELSTADAMSCPNNTVTVTVYDSNGYIRSYEITKEKDGNPFVTTTLHRYTFDHNRILIDSSFTIEKGFLHSLTSEEITNHKFDKNGNMIFEMRDGGGQYSSSRKESWMYNDKNNQTYHATYNTCGSDKPESEEVDIYYGNGKKIKEVIEINDYEKTETFYDKNARIIKEIRIPVQKDESDDMKVYETIAKNMRKKDKQKKGQEYDDRVTYKSTEYTFVK